MPAFVALAPLPIVSAGLFVIMLLSLRHLSASDDRSAIDWIPFASAVALFAIAFAGLAYSFYPHIIPEMLTTYDAASAPESLMIILVGTLVVMPVILGYTALSYVIFRGKATELRYD